MESSPPSPRRFRLDLAYEGRPYAGWQSQPGGGAVPDAVETALAAVCPEVTSVQGSGRTDAGVSALGQVAHFDTPPHWRMEGGDWLRALNTKLPPTIRVMACREVDPAFHARFSAVEKTYEYEIATGPVLPPLRHGLAWPSGPSPRKLRVASARIAAAIANDASTRTGVTPLGSMCLKRIDRSGRPTARADCTKSWFRMRRNSARMNRAAPVQLTQPMIAIIT